MAPQQMNDAEPLRYRRGELKSGNLLIVMTLNSTSAHLCQPEVDAKTIEESTALTPARVSRIRFHATQSLQRRNRPEGPDGQAWGATPISRLGTAHKKDGGW